MFVFKTWHWACFRIEESEIQDLNFLHGCANPTLILLHQDLNGRHIKTHELSLKEKEFVKVTRNTDHYIHLFLLGLHYASS